MIQLGDTAPDFTLMNTENKPVNLSELRGEPVLLLFFPLAFTGVCTAELCGVRDDLSWYNNLNVRAFGISVDSSFTLKKFKEEQQLNFDLLSDFNKNVSKSYGCLYETFHGMNGVSKRSAFIVDTNGKISYAEVLENAGELPNFAAIKECLTQA